MDSYMQSKNRIVVFVLLVMGLLALVVVPLALADDTTIDSVSAASKRRPIQEFVDAQGTYCIDDGAGGCFIFEEPLPNFLGQSDPARNLAASVDYAGFAEEYIVANGGDSLGTRTRGSVTEKARSDGRANVHVLLRTKNALVWVAQGEDFSGPLLFGNKVLDVMAGATPALCLSVFEIKFINTAPGAPLPDLMQLLFAPEPGQEVVALHTTCNAKGEFHAAYGVPEGKRGRAQIEEKLRVINGNYDFKIERVLLKVAK